MNQDNQERLEALKRAEKALKEHCRKNKSERQRRRKKRKQPPFPTQLDSKLAIIAQRAKNVKSTSKVDIDALVDCCADQTYWNKASNREIKPPIG